MATRRRPAAITITTIMTTTGNGLLKLAAWTSPAFPVGAFAYSHGLEWAVEAGLVGDAMSLQDWVAHLLVAAAPRQDAVLLARSYRGIDDTPGLLETARLAAVLKGSAELAQETVVQGEAFLRTVRAGWPAPQLDAVADLLRREEVPLALPVAVGISAAAHRVDLSTTLRFFLHGVAANAVSAAIRLSVIGQTAGQQVTAALEPVVADVADRADATDPEDLGTAAAMVDWCSMRHETQHTRLFRS